MRIHPARGWEQEGDRPRCEGTANNLMMICLAGLCKCQSLQLSVSLRISLVSVCYNCLVSPTGQTRTKDQPRSMWIYSVFRRCERQNVLTKIENNFKSLNS